jgi:hypothetical protein
MGTFVKHTNCTSCGSSDAKALYSDGGWFCFSCKASSRGSVLSRLRDKKQSKNEQHPLPDDLTTHFPPHYLSWFSKYELSPEMLIKHHVRYSPSWDRVFYTWPPTGIWQSRKNPEKKLFTSGSHDNVLLLYRSSLTTSRCVLTEDPLSSIKIASLSPVDGATIDAMPLLGVYLHPLKLKALTRLYEQVDVFLDHDKGKEAMKISTQLRNFGLLSKIYVHPKDPKEIPYDELSKLLH